jgi:hypothetical protein
MEKDKCVVCGSDTPYDKTTHVDFRQHYIKGSGQLCSKCHKEVYNTKREDQ